jgi:nicotinate phosphoribosyltransferase
MAGVRLDSGDLAPLAREARRILDEAGFPGAVIVGSNELDERSLAALKARGAPIGAWGVGTRLATAYDEPALGGVYKLTAVRRPGGALEPRLKISEDPAKTSFPGAHQVRRYLRGEAFAADVIYDAGRDLSGGCAAVEPAGRRERLEMSGRLASEDLLVPVFRAGARVAALPDVHAARARAADQVARLPEGVKRLDRPEWYPVAIEACLHGTRERLAARQRRRIAGGRGAGRRRGA